MNKILDGQYSTNAFIGVLDDRLNGTGPYQKEVKPPKLIVGISVTHPKTTFNNTNFIFPAILDTGFNGAFEISSRHLYMWNATPKNEFELLGRRNRLPMKTGFDIRHASVWVHLEPYMGPKFTKGQKQPFRLRRTDQILVMDDSTTVEPEPRFPVLGLQVLKANGLRLFVDGPTESFALYE